MGIYTGEFEEWTIEELMINPELKRPEGLFAEYVLAPPSVCFLAGAAGVGKTFFALKLGACIATGTPLGHPTKKAPVLFLSEEMVAGEMQDRVKRLFTPEEAAAIAGDYKFRFRTGIRIDTNEGIAMLNGLIRSAGSRGLVIIDALIDIHRGKEKENEDMGILMKRVRDEVAAPNNVTVLIIHHFGKPSEFREGLALLRGASSLAQVAADVISIQRRKSDKARVVTFEKVRHGLEPDKLSFVLRENKDGTVEFRVDVIETTDDENEKTERKAYKDNDEVPV